MCLNRSTDTCELIVKTSQQTLFGKNRCRCVSVYHDYTNSSVAAAAVADTPVATLAPSNDTFQFCLFTHFVGEAARTRSGYPCYPYYVPRFSMRNIRIPSPPNTNRSTLGNRCGCTGAVAVAIAVASASEQMIIHNGESMCVTEN